MARRGEINLGDEAKDTITGFTGIVIAITEWLNGCQRLSIQPKELREGKPIDNHVFDVEQLEFVQSLRKPEPVRRTGGDRPAVARAADPK